MHVQRLSQYYSLDQKDQFAKDFALLFGGLPTASHNDVQALIASSGGPPIPIFDKSGYRVGESFLSYNDKKSLPEDFRDSLNGTNQSHHYAGAFYTSYILGPDLGAMINFGRDIRPYNSGDILLGGQASIDAYLFMYHSIDLSSLSSDIAKISNR